MAEVPEQIVDIESLRKAEYKIAFFRVSADLGVAVDLHYDALVAAIDADGSLPGPFVAERSNDWIDSHLKQLSRRKYTKHVEFVRNRVGVSASEEELVEAAQAYRAIAGEMQEKSPEVLAAHLLRMMDKVYDLIGKIFEEINNAAAINRWQTRPRAPLAFDHNWSQPTKCVFSDGVIIIRIGSPKKSGGLGSYFTYDFQFLHEYLSHSFAVCQESAFTEGYLVWAAQAMLYGYESDPVRDHFAMKAFPQLADVAPEEIKMRTDNENEDHHQEVTIAKWFHATTRSRFLPFLLELATQEKTRVELYILRSLFLRAKNKAALVRRAFEQSDFQSIKRDLQSVLRERLGIPPLTRLDFSC